VLYQGHRCRQEVQASCFVCRLVEKGTSKVSGTHYLWVARLDNSAELKVTDPKEQQGDVEEEEAKGEERRDCIEQGVGC